MPFTKKNLLHFQEMTPTPLEITESIEMLRAIEHGLKVRMVKIDMISKSVDNDSDRKVAEELMREDVIYKKYGY
jgi:3-deoxy-manno-octulosonate cytidylyltransferase (CMP-KDO synthetase)